MLKTLNRFLSHVRRAEEGESQEANGCRCLLWTGSMSSEGYGVLDGFYAHRVAWFLVRGLIPNGLLVRHDCDNKLCCEVSHLRLGTHADNMRDRAGCSVKTWRKRLIERGTPPRTPIQETDLSKWVRPANGRLSPEQRSARTRRGWLKRKSVDSKSLDVKRLHG